MIPRATYRIQFHAGFGFAAAEAIVPYLDRLGVSHLYASPITTARTGSTHGYDVVDATRINPELGGEAGFRSLVAALRAHGMGVIVDIVPNHMGVAGGENAWWNDVLANGQRSAHAATFDIDWRERLVLPILGEPLAEAIAAGALAVERRDGVPEIVAYGEHRLPIRPDDADRAEAMPLAALLDRQHYRLAHWRAANDELNWRRFFTINDLAGVRVEDPAVFEATHALILRLYAEGLIDGVRIDHIDGLTDPAGYCRTLRTRLDALDRPADAPPGAAWIVVEKILGRDEPLATDWQVDGTSGYDFMEQVALLLHDPAGAEPLGRLWAKVSGRPATLAPEELRARQDLLAWQFTGQLDACTDAFVGLARSTPTADAITPAMLRRAIERLLWVFPVYRTYGTGTDAPPGDAAIRAAVRARVAPFVPPGEGSVVDAILGWLAGTGPGDAAMATDAVRRFQQLSAPIAAKAVEDTAFYRHGRLLSRNDVGFDAARMGSGVAAFHAAMQARAATTPHAMLATATHDHKRGEDTRARLAVLSQVPDAWREAVTRWDAIAAGLVDGIDPADRYMLFQTLLGAWPADGASDAFADRVVAWQDKALREAKLRSSWEDPDTEYEQRCAALVHALLADAGFVGEVEAFLATIAPAAAANALVQVALRYTVPGVPDLYQGTELADLSLVDPDNRRPVDYPHRAALLAGGSDPKLALIAQLLALRRDHPALFADDSYTPAAVQGDPDAILAFTRRSTDGTAIDCAMLIRDTDGWQDATIAFADGATLSASEVFTDAPVWFALRG